MKIVFATSNAHKVKEIKSLLPDHIQLLSLTDIGCTEEIPETQPTIEGNAIQKAQYVKDHYEVDCFAEDTGLEIHALDGAPGVYSARYAGPQRSAEDNMDKALSALEEQSNRSARFKTVIALTLDGAMHTFEGIVDGHILTERSGDGGFGYDPIFQPKESDQSFGQMNAEEKNKISHRARATMKLIAFLNALSS